ncbi:MAG: hypothetical protein R3B52_01280 [Candidatus Paceibacterota bacterium]
MKSEKGFTFLALLALIGVLFFAIWFLYSPYMREGLFINLGTLSPEREQELIATGKEHLIQITRQGFIPEILEVEQFDTVTFRNVDTILHQPVSEAAENKGACLGFAAPEPLVLNQEFSIVFQKRGTCEFSDALTDVNPGEITITRFTR